MSEVNQGGAQANTSGASEENQNNIAAPVEPAKPSKTASSQDWEKYRRDMLKYKDEVSDLREKLSEYELKEQEQKGNFQKVIEKLKRENNDLKTKYSQERYNYVYSKIEDSIKTAAIKEGCKDPDTFFRLIDQEDIKALEVDDKFRPSKDQISSLIESSRKKYEHLGFFEKKVNIVDKAPSGQTNLNNSKTKELAEMSKDELLAHAKKLGFKTLKL